MTSRNGRDFRRLAKLIEEHRSELLEQFVSDGRSPTIRNAERWVIEQDIRLWFVNHGKCLFQIAPMEAKCHEVGGTTHWSNTEPSIANRSPDVCLGCPMFAVDRDHAPFWQERYVQNQRAYLSAKGKPTLGEFRVAKSRAIQSAAVLKAIGVELPVIQSGGQGCRERVKRQ